MLLRGRGFEFDFEFEVKIQRLPSWALRLAPLLLLLLLTGCFPFSSGSGDEPTLLEAAVALGAGSERADTVWPGFSLVEEGFLLYEPGRAALLVGGAPPQGFVAVADSLLPPPLRGRTFSFEGALPGLDGGIDTRYAIGGVLTTAYPLGSSLSGTLAGMYHEAFHRYQQRAFADARVEGEGVPAGALTREFQALIEVERRMLARALQLEPGPARDSLVLGFLAVRHRRLDEAPQRVRDVERELERKEGSANLVGFGMAAATLGRERGRVVAAIGEYLTMPLDRFGSDPATQVMRWRAYGTGAAMGLLLDAKGAAWRGPLERGAGFDQLLADAYDADPAAFPALASRALAAFEYEGIRADVDEPAPASGELEAFYAMAPVRVVVEVVPRDSAADNPALSFNFSVGWRDRLFRRRAGISRPREGLTLIWRPTVLHTTNPAAAGFDLRVREHPVALAFAPGAEPDRIIVLLRNLPSVNGQRARTGAGDYPGGVMLEGDGFRLEAGRAATVTVVEPDSVHVRMGG